MSAAQPGDPVDDDPEGERFYYVVFQEKDATLIRSDGRLADYIISDAWPARPYAVATGHLTPPVAGDLRERIMFAIGAIQERNYETGRLGVLDLDPVEVTDAIMAVLVGERSGQEGV